MRWDLFLLNQFILNYREEQTKGAYFHYSWFLIIIAFEVWHTLRKYVKFLAPKLSEFIAS